MSYVGDPLEAKAERQECLCSWFLRECSQEKGNQIGREEGANRTGVWLDSSFSLTSWGAVEHEPHHRICPTLRPRVSFLCSPISQSWAMIPPLWGGAQASGISVWDGYFQKKTMLGGRSSCGLYFSKILSWAAWTFDFTDHGMRLVLVINSKQRIS